MFNCIYLAFQYLILASILLFFSVLLLFHVNRSLKDFGSYICVYRKNHN